MTKGEALLLMVDNPDGPWSAEAEKLIDELCKPPDGPDEIETLIETMTNEQHRPAEWLPTGR